MEVTDELMMMIKTKGKELHFVYSPNVTFVP